MLDARQAELGRQLAERPPLWAIDAWGVAPGAEPGGAAGRLGAAGGHRRSPTGRRPGSPTRRRRSARCPPARRSCARRSTPPCVALELPDDQALLRAMGRGELEATVAAHDRAAAPAPPDVQAEIGERERDLEDAQVRAHIAGYDDGRRGSRRGGGRGRRCRRRTWPGSPSPTRPAGNGPRRTRRGRGRPGRRGASSGGATRPSGSRHPGRGPLADDRRRVRRLPRRARNSRRSPAEATAEAEAEADDRTGPGAGRRGAGAVPGYAGCRVRPVP